MSAAPVRAGLALLLALVAGGCAAPCEAWFSFSQRDSPGCATCVEANCSAEGRAVSDVASSCESQYSAALNCNNCACYSNAVSSPICRQPLDNYVACVVARCASACR